MNFSQAHGDHLDPDRHDVPRHAAFVLNDADALEVRYFKTAADAARVSADLEARMLDTLEVVFADATQPSPVREMLCEGCGKWFRAPSCNRAICAACWITGYTPYE